MHLLHDPSAWTMIHVYRARDSSNSSVRQGAADPRPQVAEPGSRRDLNGPQQGPRRVVMSSGIEQSGHLTCVPGLLATVEPKHGLFGGSISEEGAHVSAADAAGSESARCTLFRTAGCASSSPASSAEASADGNRSASAGMMVNDEPILAPLSLTGGLSEPCR